MHTKKYSDLFNVYFIYSCLFMRKRNSFGMVGGFSLDSYLHVASVQAYTLLSYTLLVWHLSEIIHRDRLLPKLRWVPMCANLWIFLSLPILMNLYVLKIIPILVFLFSRSCVRFRWSLYYGYASNVYLPDAPYPILSISFLRASVLLLVNFHITLWHAVRDYLGAWKKMS